MAPKSAPKKAAVASTHGSYQDMIKDAIIQLKERNGSSRQAIKKYVKANNKLGSTTDNAYTSHISKAIASGVTNGTFLQPKGASGPVKLNKPGSAAEKKTSSPAKAKVEEQKPAAAKTAAKKAPAKKTAAPAKAAPAKKAPAAKPKAAAAKKPAAKKAAAPAKKTPTKKAAAKPKVADAVAPEKPKVLTTTKTGRVVKSTAPQPTKKAAPKKAAAKKATPKKATPKKA